MQKKLIALAVAAAFSAPAFADVTAYGVVDAALAHISADGQKSDVQAVSGGLSTSRFGVKTVEDLNNGAKAVVVLEYAIDPQTNSSVGATTTSASAAFVATGVNAGKSNGKSPFAARQQMLAVAGDFGTFATGYLQTTGYDFAVKFDPTTGSSVSPLQSMTKGTNVIGSVTAGARAPRALAYISPDLNGVTVAVNYTTDLTGGLGNLTLADTTPDASLTKVNATLLSATYNGGPLSVGAVYASTSNAANSKLDYKEYALGASYDFGVAKLFATYQNNKSDLAAGSLASFAAKVMSFSAVAPVGPGAAVFSYAKNSSDWTGGKESGSGYTLAWLQPLSKLTTAYAAIEKVSNGDNATAFTVDSNIAATSTLKAGGSSTLLAVGLKKQF